MRNLSKSKIIAYRQCPKRLWLEIHQPDLRDDSAFAMVFQIGNQVGDLARSLCDVYGNGEFIDIHSLGHEQALARSAVLLEMGEVPVFEAGIAAGGALAYADASDGPCGINQPKRTYRRGFTHLGAMLEKIAWVKNLEPRRAERCFGF